MTHCRKQKCAQSRTERMQTRSATATITTASTSNYRHHLRKRRPSLRYTEEDVHCDPIQLTSSRRMSDTNNEIPFNLDNFTTNKQSSAKMNSQPKREGAPSPLSHEQQQSDKDSVVSSDSYDSGVGSKSDEDVATLPLTPEKQSAKPITIAVVSPASRGVIELIDNGDGYVGYFKPDTSLNTSSCTNCALKRSRITRSISTNVSEDSNDSAFQGFRTNRRRDSHDIVKPTNNFKKENIVKKSSKKIDTGSEGNKLRGRLSRKRHRSPSTSPRKDIRSSPVHKKVPASSSKQLIKSSPAKRALMRIQHHNRSPERSAEVVTSTNIATTRNRCTRSHVKSLMKDMISNTTPASKKTSSPRPKHTLRKTSAYTKPASHYGPKGQCESSSSRSSTRASRCTIAVSENLKGEDSGVGSDDQQPVSSSACQWRFCKSEVSPADLADHIERLHVASQRRNSRVYKCYWEGCKVYGQVAKSIIWLEGHVKKHLGPRPYYCIFPECSARFPSQELLQKHVDTHIDEVEPVRTTKKVEPSIVKKTEKKKIKRMRGTEKCIPKGADFFTSNILEAVRWEYKMQQENWAHLLTEGRDSLRLHGQIVAMATFDNVQKVQIHWFPEELHLADSWHDITDQVTQTRTKEVKLSSLDRDLLIGLLRTSAA